MNRFAPGSAAPAAELSLCPGISTTSPGGAPDAAEHLSRMDQLVDVYCLPGQTLVFCLTPDASISPGEFKAQFETACTYLHALIKHTNACRLILEMSAVADTPTTGLRSVAAHLYKISQKGKIKVVFSGLGPNCMRQLRSLGLIEPANNPHLETTASLEDSLRNLALSLALAHPMEASELKARVAHSLEEKEKNQANMTRSRRAHEVLSDPAVDVQTNETTMLISVLATKTPRNAHQTGAGKLQQLLLDAVEQARLSGLAIEIDLSRVSYVSDEGLGVLTATQKVARRAGLQFRFRDPSRNVQHAFESKGFSALLLTD